MAKWIGLHNTLSLTLMSYSEQLQLHLSANRYIGVRRLRSSSVPCVPHAYVAGLALWNRMVGGLQHPQPRWLVQPAQALSSGESTPGAYPKQNSYHCRRVLSGGVPVKYRMLGISKKNLAHESPIVSHSRTPHARQLLYLCHPCENLRNSSNASVNAGAL